MAVPTSKFASIVTVRANSLCVSTMVRAQMLSELEEIIAYKQFADQPERQGTMRKIWMKRLQGCQPDVEVWQRILQIRALVLSPEDDAITWIKFANLCRKSDRMFLAEKTINSLLTPEKVCNGLRSLLSACDTHHTAANAIPWATWHQGPAKRRLCTLEVHVGDRCPRGELGLLAQVHVEPRARPAARSERKC